MPDFGLLEEFLHRVPGLLKPIGSGGDQEHWWVKFAIDVDHELAWNVVQEFAHVLNYLSIDERLPTIFKPVSPPPYLNGGPSEFLSWVIECGEQAFSPTKCAEWLEGRLPNPVDDLNSWREDADSEIE